MLKHICPHLYIFFFLYALFQLKTCHALKMPNMRITKYLGQFGNFKLWG